MIEYLQSVHPFTWIILYLSIGFIGALTTVIVEKVQGTWQPSDIGLVFGAVTVVWPLFLIYALFMTIGFIFTNIGKWLDAFTTIVANQIKRNQHDLV